MKNIRVFLSEIFQFSIYLNRRVFEMHGFISMATDSRRVSVSYRRNHVHKYYSSSLRWLSLLRKSVSRLTDRLDRTLTMSTKPKCSNSKHARTHARTHTHTHTHTHIHTHTHTHTHTQQQQQQQQQQHQLNVGKCYFNAMCALWDTKIKTLSWQDCTDAQTG